MLFSGDLRSSVARSLPLFTLRCLGAAGSNVSNNMSEEKQVMYKLLEVRGKHEVCVGEEGLLHLNVDPKVVLFLSGV